MPVSRKPPLRFSPRATVTGVAVKILVVTSTFPRWPGDTDPTFVHELSRRLVDPGTEVHILAPHTAGAARRESLDGLTVHRFRYAFERFETLAYSTGILDKLRANRLNYLLVPFFLLGMTAAAYRLVRRERYTVVHAHWLIPQGAACAAALRFMAAPPPLVCTSHGGDLFGLRGALPGLVKRWVLARSQAVTVVSHYMREYLNATLQPRNAVAVMSMGVDLQSRFVPVDGVARAAHDVVFVGRLVEKKGVTYLLRAIARVQTRLPQLHVRIVGDGPLRAGLEAEATALGITDRVTFMGAVTQDRLPALYSAAAVAVVPSVVTGSGDQEGLGLVTVEALGCGCAVIASDLPAIRDVIAPGENGLLVPPEDVAALADALVGMLGEARAANRFQAAARASVVDRFDWEATAARYRALLQDAARARAASER